MLTLVTAACALSALVGQPTPRQQQLYMLRDLATVKKNIAKVQEVVVVGGMASGVANTDALYASLQRDTNELVSNLNSFEKPMIEAQPESAWPRWTSTCVSRPGLTHPPTHHARATPCPSEPRGVARAG